MQFGFAEIVNLQRSRLYTARAVGNTPTTCVFMPREKYLEYFCKDDIRKLIDKCLHYNDFDKEGKE
jgi:hypothetical protein